MKRTTLFLLLLICADFCNGAEVIFEDDFNSQDSYYPEFVKNATVQEYKTGDVQIDFAEKLRDWDGFGVNYVECAQTADPVKSHQDYGGFSTLSKKKREKILDMIFGKNGLKPGIVKLFITPFNEGSKVSDNDNADPNKIELSKLHFHPTIPLIGMPSWS